MNKNQANIHPSWVEVNLSQFKKNILSIQKAIGSTLFCLPVKANAYGHGLCQIGLTAQESGVDYLAVSCPQEGIALREAGVKINILVLGPVFEEQLTALSAYDLEFTISSIFKAELVAAFCAEKSIKCKIHVKIDTGMQRLGVRPESAKKLVNFLKNNPSFFAIKSIYSHFATADEPNNSFAKQQLEIFNNTIAELDLDPNVIQHIANSGALCFLPNSQKNMVRPGLLTYGYLPDENAKNLFPGIAPCFSLKSKISYFKVVEKGLGISYGHRYTTNERTRIVTVPIGYGDGYRRSLSNQGKVLIRNQIFPIVGSICMDQLMVDINGSEAFVGDEVTLIDPQHPELSINALSKFCDTIPYEILCALNDRIPRIYCS